MLMRGIIDDASERSFVVEESSGKLRLQVVDVVELIFNEFDQPIHNRRKMYRVVRTTLQRQYGNTECFIDAVEITTICQNIGLSVERVSFVRKFMNIGKNVADLLEFTFDSRRNDQMWRVMTGV